MLHFPLFSLQPNGPRKKINRNRFEKAPETGYSEHARGSTVIFAFRDRSASCPLPPPFSISFEQIAEKIGNLDNTEKIKKFPVVLNWSSGKNHHFLGL